VYRVPHGSVLGPLLFLLYINDIENCVRNATVKLFVDDTNLFVHGKSLSEAFDKANDAVNLLQDWFVVNKLSLNEIQKNHVTLYLDVIILLPVLALSN